MTKKESITNANKTDTEGVGICRCNICGEVEKAVPGTVHDCTPYEHDGFKKTYGTFENYPKIDFVCSCGRTDYMKNTLATEDGDLDVLICEWCGLVHEEADIIKKKKGVLVNVYRGGSDSTNRGISSKFGLFILVGEGVPKVHEVTKKTPALKLVRRMIAGEEYLHVEPIHPVPKGNVGYMMGGNFVYSPDSRFRDINDYPIPVHDRSDSVEMHKLLSM